MSNEKRQTRLLPFRLRRAAHTDAGADGVEDFSADAELTTLLRTWNVPPQDAGARARLLADFRVSVRRAPLWRRALTAQVRVPLPIAACAAVALLLSLYALGARATVSVAPSASQAGAAPAAVRVVEVPVIKERVVTNTIYVEKKERGAARSVSTRADAREALAQRDERGLRDAEAPHRQEPAQSPGSHAGYYTRVDMNDFQPADEMKIRIVKRGGVDEK
ncbi:MAG: hypothetical protein QOH49_2010 [Acidobacteriota bacterium]|jgi:hypothetical protein|nr:hypothetical protein [Acidobacteriota bacterium]